MAEGDQPPDDSLLDEVIGETTNCPTQTTNAEVAAPTTITTEGGGGLPRTGTNAMPMLLAGLVLVAGGAAAVLGSRLRGRATK
jgi:LPXTG-motif cell wall-anchored protein